MQLEIDEFCKANQIDLDRLDYRSLRLKSDTLHAKPIAIQLSAAFPEYEFQACSDLSDSAYLVYFLGEIPAHKQGEYLHRKDSVIRYRRKADKTLSKIAKPELIAALNAYGTKYDEISDTYARINYYSNTDGLPEYLNRRFSGYDFKWADDLTEPIRALNQAGYEYYASLDFSSTLIWRGEIPYK